MAVTRSGIDYWRAAKSGHRRRARHVRMLEIALPEALNSSTRV
jgi:hypothetical protein